LGTKWQNIVGKGGKDKKKKNRREEIWKGLHGVNLARSSAVRYSAVQYNKAPFSKAQYSIRQYTTAQFTPVKKWIGRL
jgi:hypothetical protein